MDDKTPKEVKMTAGAGSGLGRIQKAALAGGAHPHIHDPKTHADGHDSGHKKVARLMMKPFHNEDQE